MPPSEAKQKWNDDLEHDIKVIREAGICPWAIWRRLRDVKEGRRGDRRPAGGGAIPPMGVKRIHWLQFREPVRGKSNYAISDGKHTITLEFGHHPDVARKVYAELQKLTKQFRAITDIEVRATARGIAGVTLYIPVRDLS